MTDSPDDCAKLLSLAVHEFRTPTTVVAGYLRMVLRQFGQSLTDQQRKLLEEAEKSCGRLSALLAELSDLGNLRGGTAPVQRQDVPVFSLLAEVASGVHEGADRGVTLEVRGASAPGTVVGDEARLRAAFESLLTSVLREKVEPGVVVADCGRTTGAAGRDEAVITIGSADEAPPPGGEWDGFDAWRGGLGFRLQIAQAVLEAAGGRLWSHRGRRARAATALTLPLKESR